MFVFKLVPLKGLSKIIIGKYFSRQDWEVLGKPKPRNHIHKVIKWPMERITGYSINITETGTQ